jgi:LacI family transcriptional regulator
VFESGLKVPKDISVAGFDDILLASQVWPPLTTVQQPAYKIYEIATKMMIRLLQGVDTNSLSHKVEKMVL